MSGAPQEPAADAGWAGYARLVLIAENKALRRTLARERILLLIVTAIALVAVAAHLPSPW